MGFDKCVADYTPEKIDKQPVGFWQWPTLLGMDVSEVPSSGRNRMVADNAPENEGPAGAFLHFLLIFYLFFIGDRASF